MQFLLASLFLLSGLAQASILTTSGEGKIIEGVKVANEGKLQIADRAYSVKRVGAGLRFKKVVFVKANVYVAELFLDAPEAYQRTNEGAMNSLLKQKSVALRMTFLRSVEVEKIKNGFKEGLEENKISADGAGVKGFLDAVLGAGEVKDKSTFVVAAEFLGEGKEVITVEGSNGKAVSITDGVGFIRNIFSIWLGKMSDSGLENLKKGLLEN